MHNEVAHSVDLGLQWGGVAHNMNKVNGAKAPPPLSRADLHPQISIESVFVMEYACLTSLTDQLFAVTNWTDVMR